MTGASHPVTIITPDQEQWLRQLGALWRSRHLVYWLVRRDILLRYRQTAMGFLWAILYPLALFGIYLFALGTLAKLPMPSGMSYAVYILTGLVPWLYFQNTLLATSSALQQNINLISKVYFPRLVLIASAFVGATIDFLWMALILLGVALYHGMLGMEGVPVIFFWSFMAGLLGLACGILVSAWCIYFRDLRVILPILLQMAFFLSPVVYAAHLVPEHYLYWYYFNPVSAMIESFRGGFGIQSAMLAVHPLSAIAATLASLLLGLKIFSALERELIDRM